MVLKRVGICVKLGPFRFVRDLSKRVLHNPNNIWNKLIVIPAIKTSPTSCFGAKYDVQQDLILRR